MTTAQTFAPLIVTSGDENYAPLIRELIASLAAHPQLQSHGYRIGIIDAGLSAATRAEFIAAGHLVADGIWPVPLPAYRIRGREYLRACVSRPFIPDLFPGFSHYIWLDGDTWVQRFDAIELLIAGADKSGLAIAPQVDRAYGKTVRLSWLGPFPYKPRSFYYTNARKPFGGGVARQLFAYPILNAGVFAMRADAPHWARWQDLIRTALKRGGKIFTAEQLTLGMLVWLDGYSAERMPASCNWLCEYTPVWDETAHLWREPYLPQAPIGILHLCGMDAMRKDPAVQIPVKTTSGKTVEKSLRYHPAAAYSQTQNY